MERMTEQEMLERCDRLADRMLYGSNYLAMAQLIESYRRMRTACEVALTDFYNTYPEEANLGDDARESVRLLRAALEEETK